MGAAVDTCTKPRREAALGHAEWPPPLPGAIPGPRGHGEEQHGGGVSSNLDVGDECVERLSFNDLACPLRVFREGLQPDPRLVVRVGPVVGKVTATSAVILLEVEAPGGDVTLNVARVLPARSTVAKSADQIWASAPPLPALSPDSMGFTAVGSLSVCRRLEHGRPYSFALEQLQPAMAYFVFLGGVRPQDIGTRVARFRTLPQYVDEMRLIVVSGHCSREAVPDSVDPWKKLHSAVCKGPEVQVVLHVGGTVDTAPAAEAASREVQDLGSFCLGVRKEMERRAKAAMRSAFAAAWGRHEGLAHVLAGVGSHLPTFTPILEPGTFLQKLEDPETMQERRALLRVALEVSRSYQRTLWQSSASNGVPDFRVAVTGANDAFAGPVHNSEFGQEGGSVSDMVVEEWHFHRYGQISILVLDTKGSILSSAGFSNKVPDLDQQPLLSVRQHNALNRLLKDPRTQVLLLACNIPFVLEPDRMTAPADGPRESATESASGSAGLAMYLDWRSHPDELCMLLETLFQWKHSQYPDREVVLLSPGPGFGTTGEIRDHELGLSIPTVLAGPVLGQIRPHAQWAFQGSIARGVRFSYSYRPPLDEWNFCSIDIDLGCKKPAVDLQLIGVGAPTPPE